MLTRCANVTEHFEESHGHVMDGPDPITGEKTGEAPYSGPFDLAARPQRYSVNHARREYVDMERRAPHGFGDGLRDDSLPWLLAPHGDEIGLIGRRCSDAMEVTDSPPDEGYRGVSRDASMGCCLH